MNFLAPARVAAAPAGSVRALQQGPRKKPGGGKQKPGAGKQKPGAGKKKPGGAAPSPDPPQPASLDLALPFLDPASEPDHGTRFPRPADRRGPGRDEDLDLLVHDDQHGGADQQLESLVGGPAGVAAVWRDGRNGNAGLYLGLIDRNGEHRPVQRAIHAPSSGRELHPGLAVSSDGRGAAVWFSQNHLRERSLLRLFTFGESVVGSPIPIGAATGPEARLEPGGEGANGPSIQAAVVLPEERSGLVVWREGTELLGQSLVDARTPLRSPQLLGAGVTGRPVLAEQDGRVLVVWPNEAGLNARLLEDPSGNAADSGGPISLGSGELVRLVGDPGHGWWLLLRLDGTLALRHLAPSGKPDAPDVLAPGEPLRSFDLAVWNGHLAVVTEERTGGDLRHAHGPIRLWLAERTGRLLMPPMSLPGPEARGASSPKIAASGKTIVVAWTDLRERDRNIYCRVLRPKELGRPDERLNNDQTSSNQIQASVGSGDRGMAQAVWVDERDVAPRVRMRRYTPARGWLDSDQAVSGVSPLDEQVREQQPVIAVLPDRRALVAWTESRGADHRLLARWFDGEGKPASPVFAPDEGHAALPAERVALAFEERTRRLTLACVRASGECVALAMKEGSTRAVPLVLSRTQSIARPAELRGPHEMPGRAQAPALCALNDGGLVAAWTHSLDEPWTIQVPAEQAKGLEGQPGVNPKPVTGASGVAALGRTGSVILLRRIAPDGRPLGPAQVARLSLRGRGDLEPALAASPRGGFVLAWTANNGPVRDVLAGLYSTAGVSIGPVTLISTTRGEQDVPVLVALESGDFLCVWEDDLSGPDCVLGRRLTQRGARIELGAVRQLHASQSAFVEGRTRPAACALGDGFLALWDDRRRSKGHDLFAGHFGPLFDRPLAAGRSTELLGEGGLDQGGAR